MAQLEVRAEASRLPLWLACIYSIAVSLKRLADRDNSVDLKLPEGMHNDITQMAWEAGRNFQHGMRTDR